MVAISTGVLGLAILAVFVWAIPLSYAVESRSDPAKARRRFGYTNIWAVALNIGVARDDQTQALRRKLLMRLAVMAALSLALVLVVLTARAPA